LVKPADLACRADFQAGALSISPARRRIEGPAGTIQVEPLTMQVFLLLLDHVDQVVTRDAIFEAGWGGAMVGDDSLNRAINRVRRIATEAGPGLFEIETIPRTGYRLTGDLAQGVAIHGRSEANVARQGISRRSLAIAGGAVAIAGGLGSWLFAARRREVEVEELVARADQILRFGQSTTKVSAKKLLQTAVTADPENGEALGLLALASSNLAIDSGVGSEVANAKRAIDRALAVDPRNPNARIALLSFNTGNFDWARTEDGLLAVLKDAPNNSFALSKLTFLYQGAGRAKLSWDFNERVGAVDPLAPAPIWRRAQKHWIFGRTAEADKVIDQLLRIWPRHPSVWNARFLIYAFTKRTRAALTMLNDKASLPNGIKPEQLEQWRPTLAALESPTSANRRATVEASVAAARRSAGQAAYAAMALSGIGELDAAYEITNGLLFARGDIIPVSPNNRTDLVNEQAWRHTQWITTPPMFDFRADPRFAPLCDDMGLSAYWRLRGIKPDFPPTRMPH
jgi:DNA-binding winged helix-turn-helix (wHTH) protein/tetratricopeptide (TPR) repeat protein